MINGDQKIFDMQIEVFAYWKLLKKRYIDNIIQSTRAELVHASINKFMRESLLRVILQKNDTEITSLLSHNDSFLQERLRIVYRLQNLKKALQLIEDQEKKHTLDLV